MGQLILLITPENFLAVKIKTAKHILDTNVNVLFFDSY